MEGSERGGREGRKGGGEEEVTLREGRRKRR